MHFRRIGCAVLLAATLFTPASPVKAQEVPQATINKLVSLMQQDGYAYKTTNSPTVFGRSFHWQQPQGHQGVIALGGDEDSDLVVFVTVTPKRPCRPLPISAHMLLKFNHEYRPGEGRLR